MQVEPIHPQFGSIVTDVNLKSLDEDTFADILTAFHERSVLIFPNQKMTDDEQIAFSERFGALEGTVSSDPSGGGGPVTTITNVDANGDLIPPVEGELDWTVGNELWHTDSSYKTVPAKASILSGRIVTEEGGGTGFASMTAAYDAFPEERLSELDGLTVEHSLAHSRSSIGLEMSETFKQEVPPVEQPLIREIPETGRKTFYAGAHASHVIGWPVDRGQVLVTALNEWITQPQFTFEHKWAQDDVVMWDNRCCLHRARPFDRSKYKRVMHRTTVAGEG